MNVYFANGFIIFSMQVLEYNAVAMSTIVTSSNHIRGLLVAHGGDTSSLLVTWHHISAASNDDLHTSTHHPISAIYIHPSRNPYIHPNCDALFHRPCP